MTRMISPSSPTNSATAPRKPSPTSLDGHRMIAPPSGSKGSSAITRSETCGG